MADILYGLSAIMLFLLLPEIPSKYLLISVTNLAQKTNKNCLPVLTRF
jgi:hypothetical protein